MHNPVESRLPRASATDFGGRPATVQVFDHGAELVLVRNFLAPVEKTALLNESRDYPWERQPVMGVLTLRSNAWFAESSSAVYEYTRQRWEPHSLTVLQSRIRDRLTVALGERMNSVLAAHYPHGCAAVGYHADDEALFGENPTIASLSIGATRTFQIAHKSRARPGHAEVEVMLGDGDLLVMRGTFQRYYRHALKKESTRVGPRLNLSYRRLTSVV